MVTINEMRAAAQKTSATIDATCKDLADTTTLAIAAAKLRDKYVAYGPRIIDLVNPNIGVPVRLTMREIELILSKIS